MERELAFLLYPGKYMISQQITNTWENFPLIPPNLNRNSNLKDLKIRTELAFIHSLFIFKITVL